MFGKPSAAVRKMTQAWWSSCSGCCCSWEVRSIYTVQHSGLCWVIQWSWWTVHGRKTLTAHISVVVGTFSLHLHGCCWASWRPFISTTKQNLQHSGSGVYNALLFKPSASLRSLDVGNQPWALSLDSSSCPLFTTSLRIGEEDVESSVHSKEFENQTTSSWLSSPQNTDSVLPIALQVRCDELRLSEALRFFVVFELSEAKWTFATGSSPAVSWRWFNSFSASVSHQWKLSESPHKHTTFTSKLHAVFTKVQLCKSFYMQLALKPSKLQPFHVSNTLFFIEIKGKDTCKQHWTLS